MRRAQTLREGQQGIWRAIRGTRGTLEDPPQTQSPTHFQPVFLQSPGPWCLWRGLCGTGDWPSWGPQPPAGDYQGERGWGFQLTVGKKGPGRKEQWLELGSTCLPEVSRALRSSALFLPRLCPNSALNRTSWISSWRHYHQAHLGPGAGVEGGRKAPRTACTNSLSSPWG